VSDDIAKAFDRFAIDDYIPLMDELKQLAQWGLIEAYENDEQHIKPDEILSNNIRYLTFYFSPLAAQLEDGLNISLTATSIFGPPRRFTRWPDLFMLMPFVTQLKPVFDDHVKKVASELHLSAARADDFFSKGSIIHDVWSAIYYAKVIVADCSKRNPN